MSLNITVLLENKNHHPQLDGGVGLSLLLDDGEQRILLIPDKISDFVTMHTA
ncbi:hypothetical protein [Hafnia paralvei]|uniref:hypothetical protein n=1 Tax=Hafnia paralvei TaxID=546367 RepID=UPI001D0E9C3C|nr:hypothetical protein [Hafnia paralvei]